MRGMAYVMYRALRSSGVAWPLLRPAAAPAELPVDSARPTGGEQESEGESVLGGLQGIRRLLDRAARTWALPWARPQRAG
jgi:hypothetical protein